MSPGFMRLFSSSSSEPMNSTRVGRSLNVRVPRVAVTTTSSSSFSSSSKDIMTVLSGD